MIRKPVSLLLLFTLVLGTVGVYPLFMFLQHSVQSEIRRTIKKGLSAEELDIIVFANGTSPEWIRPGKEFFYKGQMFDVVEKETRDSCVVYRCINDRREQALRTQMEIVLQEDLRSAGSPEARTCLFLQKFFAQNYLPAGGFTIVSQASHLSFPESRNCLPIKVSIPGATPPPEFG